MRCFTNCAPHLPDSHDSHDNHDGMIVFKLHRPECRTARPDAPSGSWQHPCPRVERCASSLPARGREYSSALVREYRDTWGREYRDKSQL